MTVALKNKRPTRKNRKSKYATRKKRPLSLLEKNNMIDANLALLSDELKDQMGVDLPSAITSKGISKEEKASKKKHDQQSELIQAMSKKKRQKLEQLQVLLNF